MQPAQQQKAWRAGRFWWDWPRPNGVIAQPLRAMIFDLDAIADVECAGHLPAFNAAFAARGLELEWTVARYRKLLALPDETFVQPPGLLKQIIEDALGPGDGTAAA